MLGIAGKSEHLTPIIFPVMSILGRCSRQNKVTNHKRRNSAFFRQDAQKMLYTTKLSTFSC